MPGLAQEQQQKQAAASSRDRCEDAVALWGLMPEVLRSGGVEAAVKRIVTSLGHGCSYGGGRPSNTLEPHVADSGPELAELCACGSGGYKSSSCHLLKFHCETVHSGKGSAIEC